MGRLAELIATSPLAALCAALAGLAIVLAEWGFALRRLLRLGPSGFKREIRKQAELATTRTGYIAALYSQLTIVITFNFILFGGFLTKREAMQDGGLVRDTIAPIVSTGSFAFALLMLFVAIRINFAILRRGRDKD